MLPSQDSRFSTLLEERIWNRRVWRVGSSASFLASLQRCPRQDAPWPFQQGTSRKGTASNFCAGSKASVVELNRPGAADINRVTPRQTNHPRQAKRRARRSQSAKTFGLKNAGLGCTFCVWLPENRLTAFELTCWNQTWHRKLHASAGRAGRTDPRLSVFIPSEAPKSSSVQLRYCFWLTRSTAVLRRFDTQWYHLIWLQTLVSGPTSEHFPMCPWTMRERHRKKDKFASKRRWICIKKKCSKGSGEWRRKEGMKEGTKEARTPASQEEGRKKDALSVNNNSIWYSKVLEARKEGRGRKRKDGGGKGWHPPQWQPQHLGGRRCALPAQPPPAF